MSVEYSRTARLAARASGNDESALEKRLSETAVTVSVEAGLPGAALTAHVLLETLRRQPLRLYLDPNGIPDAHVSEMGQACARIDPSRPLELAENHGITLHVGLDERALIRVIPDAHGARLRRGGKLTQLRPASGLGSIYAAALAAAEVFKDAADVLPARQIRHELLDFCPVTLSDDLEAAPALSQTEVNLGLVGVGAVGSATAHILSELPLFGRALVVDPEAYAFENLGTCSLGGRADAAAGRLKVELAAAALSRFETTPFAGRVEDAIRAIDAGDLPWSRLVLSGLDSVEARHATQLLWPDDLIDGATGDTALGLHEARNGETCLQCFFPLRDDGPSAMTRLIQATTLTAEQLADGQRLLDENDLAHLDHEHRELLRPHIGTAVCGLAQAIGLTADGDGSYLPSVPFVSQQAACLAVGRLVARIVGVGDLPNFVQYDALLGPGSLTRLNQPPRTDCYSVTNRAVIEEVRAARAARVL